METSQPVVPAWAVPPEQEVRDLLAIAAYHARMGRPGYDVAAGCADAAGWVCGWPITYDEAGKEMARALEDAKLGDRHRRGVADTLAWLIGCAPAPLEVPRRNPDGTVVTAEQLVAEEESATSLPWVYEQRRAVEDKARRRAARWQALAELT